MEGFEYGMLRGMLITRDWLFLYIFIRWGGRGEFCSGNVHKYVAG
jgi:hypothetical protein